MNNSLLDLAHSERTVFSVNILGKILGEYDDAALRNKISYYVKRGYLERTTQGIYSLKEKNINTFELGSLLYSPCYISFETALYHHGIIFQINPKQLDIAYIKSDERYIESLGLTIKMRTLKKNILFSSEGIVHTDFYALASPERAFLDTIYIFKEYYFDNLDAIDMQKLGSIISIYGRNTMMISRVQKYFPKFTLGAQ